MEEIKTIKEKTNRVDRCLKRQLSQTYGMGNDGNEYKLITQVFFISSLMISSDMK